MAIERVRRVGAYAPLSATYYMDDAIAEAGEAAELLYLRGLAFAAGRMEAEGFISNTQLVRFVGVGMADAQNRAEALVEVGLWERVQGGYVIRSWLKWNKSAEEMDRYRARDRERKAGRADKAADQHLDSDSSSDSRSERNPSGVGSDSDSASDNQYTSLHNTKSTKTISSPASRSRTPEKPATPEPGSDDDPDWVKFWATYPKRASKADARKRWKAAVKAKVDPALIIAGAERYAAEVKRKGTPRDKIKNPDGWLNGRRWEDEPELWRQGDVSPDGEVVAPWLA